MSESKGPKKLVRVWNWQEKLTTYLVESQQEGIRCDWEFHHCGGWVDGAVFEMTGESFLEPFKDVDSPASAVQAFKDAGYSSFEDFIRKNFKSKPIIFAKRGDIVLVPAVEMLGVPMMALGIADPPFFWALNEQGVGKGDLLQAAEAFGVGDM